MLLFKYFYVKCVGNDLVNVMKFVDLKSIVFKVKLKLKLRWRVNHDVKSENQR